MNRLDLFTSFACFDSRPEEHVVAALESSIANRSIRYIYVVTESPADEITAVYPMLTEEKCKLIPKVERPSFGTMVAEINRCIDEEGTEIAVLLNADVSFESEDDILRIIALMEELPGHKNALAITRHDRVGSRFQITLKTEMGLPNLITADAWVFNGKIRVRNDLYYFQGQMNCDKFFNYDLQDSGYALYNPCLDIKALHHERDVKDNDFYRQAIDKEASRQETIKHWKRSVAGKGGYAGIVRVRSSDLIAGYLPFPVQWSRSNKLFLCILPTMNYSQLEPVLQRAMSLSEQNGLEVILLFERESIRDDLVDWIIENRVPQFSLLHIDDLRVVIRNALAGRSEGLQEALFVSSPDIWSPSGMRLVAAAFVVCRPGKNFAADASAVNSPVMIPIQYRFRINGVSENLYSYVAELMLNNDKTVVLWHKNDRVNHALVDWLNRSYLRTF